MNMSHALAPGSVWAILVCVSATGCATGGTGLEPAVKQMSPAFQVKAPVTSDPQLGRRIENQQVATLQCFLGAISQPNTSWSSVIATYKSALDAQVRADFGDAVEADANAGPSTSIHVELGSVSEVRIADLFFDPASGCSQILSEPEYLNGREDLVITRALRAGTVTVTKDASTGVGLSVNTGVVDGSLISENETQSTYSGTKMYFAHFAEPIFVQRREARDHTVPVNGTPVDLGACGFTLNAVQSGRWQGTLSCQDGQSKDFEQSLNSFASWQVTSGVTYSVRVRPAVGVAQGVVDLFQFIIRPNDS